MRLAHLQLQNWKNFSRIAVELGERVFVVGPNASGKSNLLDAFRFLRDVAAPEGGLQRAIADRRGVEPIRFLGAAADAEISIQVVIDDDEGSWTYQLSFTHAEDGAAVLTRERVRRGSTDLLNRPNDHDLADRPRLRQTALEQVAANQEFRKIADFLTGIVYLHLTPELLRDPSRVRPRADDPLGSDLLDRVIRTPAALLRKKMARINSVMTAAIPELEGVTVERRRNTAPHLFARFKNWRPTAGAQTERQLSDGTLRLFGFLWALLDGEGPLLFEEPELSLHPGVVRHLASVAFAQSSRQTIISTHSVDVLSDEGIAPDEVLLLQPTAKGTSVNLASDDVQIRALLEGGLSIADTVLPGTAPVRSFDMMRVSQQP